ncbi:hypothetical protein SNL152K_488 [Streptomyces sp. NL15-2K]|nr:hypothetical protein SNL152K_488 [Streptomyces sp. NL15-2K]
MVWRPLCNAVGTTKGTGHTGDTVSAQAEPPVSPTQPGGFGPRPAPHGRSALLASSSRPALGRAGRPGLGCSITRRRRWGASPAAGTRSTTAAAGTAHRPTTFEGRGDRHRCPARSRSDARDDNSCRSHARFGMHAKLPTCISAGQELFPECPRQDSNLRTRLRRPDSSQTFSQFSRLSDGMLAPSSVHVPRSGNILF